jgi:hypothetical protein
MTPRKLALLWMSSFATACFNPGTGGEGDGTGSAGTTTGGPSVTTDDGPGQTTAMTSQGSSGGTSVGPASSTGIDDTSADTMPPVYFDLGIIPDSPMFCEQGTGDVEFSYIWIANSSQNTISKINTETLVEEGRYYTRPDQQGSPSRTSVSLTGNVAVANRSGGLTKFYANHDDCSGGNTSSGANDILPWGDEDCMAWHTPMAYTSQRPVAWTQGFFDEAQCAVIDEKVWTSGSPDGNSVEVLLVDGETGVIEETIPIPGVQAQYFGIYGAAVDSDGNFWGSQLGIGHLVYVDRQSFDFETWPMAASGYGMTVDQEGYVWTCSSTAARFDPVSETWDQANVGGGGGCMSDGGDILWMASQPLIGINRQTLAVEYSIPIPDYVHGVSIDHQGYVWGVSMNTNAYRVDPDNGTWDTVGGLVGPYTYSDMTGFALNNVGGGGAPSG